MLSTRFLAISLALLSPFAAPAEIAFLPVPPDAAFPDATAPNALQFACADSPDELSALFRRKDLVFSAALVAPREGRNACHIYYEPSVKGYRASSDSRPIQGLFVAVDPLSFIVRRKPIGDSLSIAKQVLARVGRPLDVTLSVAGGFSSGLWPEALKFHFGESNHRFHVRQSGAASSHPWAQDHQKAGEVGGRLRILVPRRLFEGRREDGDAFGPMLGKLDDPVFTRSKLSWEGGDIQFVRDPKAPSRLVLVHGGVGRTYWGASLTSDEASYVLAAEFGADTAIDLTPVGVHVDYAVAFLPADGIALVSRSIGEDPQVLRAAAGVLARLCGRQPPPAMLDLQRFLANWNDDLAAAAGPLRGLIGGLERSLAAYSFPEDAALSADLATFADSHCGGDAPACSDAESKGRMFALAPDLLRRSAEQSTDAALFHLAAARMLALMEAQLPRPPAPRELALEGAARAIEELGFRVIRAPYVYAPKLSRSWAGVSYVNSFIDGRAIFMPALGFGPLESAMFAELEQKIGAGYQIIPVDAWSSILNNGGAHCVFGIVREPLVHPPLSE